MNGAKKSPLTTKTILKALEVLKVEVFYSSYFVCMIAATCVLMLPFLTGNEYQSVIMMAIFCVLYIEGFVRVVYHSDLKETDNLIQLAYQTIVLKDIIMYSRMNMYLLAATFAFIAYLRLF